MERRKVKVKVAGFRKEECEEAMIGKKTMAPCSSRQNDGGGTRRKVIFFIISYYKD
jgi:hypothetical protein